MVNQAYTVIYAYEYSGLPGHTATNPKVNTNLVYNGNEQEGVTGDDTVILNGQTTGTDAGVYHAQAAPIKGYT